jgi:hypothetical protein
MAYFIGRKENRSSLPRSLARIPFFVPNGSHSYPANAKYPCDSQQTKVRLNETLRYLRPPWAEHTEARNKLFARNTDRPYFNHRILYEHTNFALLSLLPGCNHSTQCFAFPVTWLNSHCVPGTRIQILAIRPAACAFWISVLDISVWDRGLRSHEWHGYQALRSKDAPQDPYRLPDLQIEED